MAQPGAAWRTCVAGAAWPRPRSSEPENAADAQLTCQHHCAVQLPHDGGPACMPAASRVVHFGNGLQGDNRLRSSTCATHGRACMSVPACQRYGASLIKTEPHRASADDGKASRWIKAEVWTLKRPPRRLSSAPASGCAVKMVNTIAINAFERVARGALRKHKARVSLMKKP